MWESVRARALAAAVRGLAGGGWRRPLAHGARFLLVALATFAGDRRRVTELRVSEHSRVAVDSGVLEPAARVTVPVPTHWRTEAAKMIPVDSSPVRWSVIHDVELNDTSLVRSGRTLVSPTDVDRALVLGLRIKGPGIVAHDGHRVLVEALPPRRRIDGAIRLCGFGSNNWYHWLVEILPSATLLENLPAAVQDLPLLVPEAVLHQDAWREALQVVVGERPLVVASRASTLAVDRLVWLDSVVSGPRTLRDGSTPDLGMLAPSLAPLARLRERVLGGLGITRQPVPYRRVMIVRPPDTRRSANEGDLVKIARDRGFEPIDPGRLSFREQVELFARAEFVTGGWGAAWSSMLFASDGARALMWAPEFFSRWTLYSQLAQVSGLDLRHLFVTTEGATFKAANSATQHVPTDEFAAALDALLPV